MKPPILIITHTRDESFKQVLSSVTNYSSDNILVFCDGPRNEQDISSQKEISRIISKSKMEGNSIEFIHSKKNLGCKYGVIEAINQFFTRYEEGIILEDDCIPSDAFFYYCQHCLEQFRENNNILTIGGTNILSSQVATNEDYFFSAYPLMWGWATWKHSWKKYDVSLQAWNQDNRKDIFAFLSVNTILEKLYWNRNFNKYKFDTNANAWGFAWILTSASNNCLNIVPKENLVTNVGFGLDAVHTQNKSDSRNSIPFNNSFRVRKDNSKLMINFYYDRLLQKHWFKINLPNFLKYLIKRLLGRV